MKEILERNLKQMPVVAIIRGVKPDEVVEIGRALIRAGIRVIEVPLNSPNAFDSIRNLTEACGQDCITGAGTVLAADDVSGVKDAGGSLIVTPNTNPQVIKRAVDEGLIPFAGFATATEAFTAYAAGARHLKLFPANIYGTGYVRALRTVLPDEVRLYAVGGIGVNHATEWFSAGVDGFGVGGNLYRPGDNPEEVFRKAQSWVDEISGIER